MCVCFFKAWLRTWVPMPHRQERKQQPCLSTQEPCELPTEHRITVLSDPCQTDNLIHVPSFWIHTLLPTSLSLRLSNAVSPDLSTGRVGLPKHQQHKPDNFRAIMSALLQRKTCPHPHRYTSNMFLKPLTKITRGTPPSSCFLPDECLPPRLLPVCYESAPRPDDQC